MDSFSISQLSQYSGIKPHTIRIWEQRYNAFKPNRSVGNTRFYDGAQLRRLLNIVTLSKLGHRISELCQMTDEVMFDLLDSEVQDPGSDQQNYLISQLLLSGVSYDEVAFDKIFAHSLLRYGMKECYSLVLFPMLKRVGLLWSSDKILAGQEHFISNCIRRKLFTAIDALPAPFKDRKTWLLFLPENEFHEIGLLLAWYLIRLSGDNVIYLGANVPLDSIVEITRKITLDRVLLFYVHNDSPENINKYLEDLTSVYNNKIYISASNHQMIYDNPNKQIHYLFSPEELLKQLP